MADPMLAEDGCSWCCCYGVPEGTRGVKQSCGAYTDTLQPGCNPYCCLWQTIAPMSIRVHQCDVHTDTKTKDNVTIRVQSAIQFNVNTDMIFEAFFKLNDVDRQMSAFVDDVIRSEMPGKDLDEAYSCKGEIASNVHKALADNLQPYGIHVYKVLVTDLQPDHKVQAAMNEINTQKRNRAAATERAEADKLMKVKIAEADMEAKHLSGLGLAKMRRAITSGFKDSIQNMQQNGDMSARDVVDMMLVTQYLDTLKEFAAKNTNAVFVPSNQNDTESQVRQGFVTAGMLGSRSGGVPPPPGMATGR